MNKIKQIFDDYVIVPCEPIDPYEFCSSQGPWIVGSFALWHYITQITGKNPDWKYDDIDYAVGSADQGNLLLEYFRQSGETETLLYDGIYKFNQAQINVRPYEDIRFRLYLHDIDVCQVGTDNKNFYLSSSAFKSISENTCRITGNTFDQSRTDKRLQKYIDRGFLLAY